MVKKKKLKAFLAASLSTVVLASSYYNVKAYDNTTLEKTLESAAVVDRLSESDEQTLTLITGDVVKVKKIENGKSVINVEPADPNDAGVHFIS
jgi:formylmethanofuran dehydrogenase subunit D